MSHFCECRHLDIFPSEMRRGVVFPDHSHLLFLVFCNSTRFSFLYIQTKNIDCSHIEDVHLLFCAHLINIFSVFTGVEHQYFIYPKCVGGVRFV